MILLQASHITKQFDGHDVLQGATVVVQSGERVALVGSNGAGKSTLLRIITGDLSADDGEVSLQKGATMGYVSQFTVADSDVTVYEYISQTFQHLYDMEAKLRRMEQEMAHPEVYGHPERFEELSSAYDRLQTEFTDAGGYAAEARIRRVLDGLRFPSEMHNRPVHTLSGGQKTRLSLARLLAWQPSLLVLDEPTNYLDTDTLSWLEDYLQTYDGSVLVVSHDRYFLDKVVQVIYELEYGKTTRFTGNYSDFIDQKAARYEEDLKRYEAQQEEIQRLETFVQKNIVRASTTKRAQSRRKLLEKMLRLERPSANTPKLALQFQTARTSGKDVLRLDGLRTGYPDKPLAGPLNLYVPRGQRIALIGPNGIGKTTFIKTLVGILQPLGGSIQWGTNVDIGYYDQEQTDLNLSTTVLEQVWADYPGLDNTTVRTALGRFLFRGEDVNKPVHALSGGERSRLALCRLMLQQANVLVMDEPTNHLDLLSKEVLEDALQDYDGTLLMVSHDRYFIDALATHVLVLDDRGFTTYIGNYSEYMLKRSSEEKWDVAEAERDAFGPSELQPVRSVRSVPWRGQNTRDERQDTHQGAAPNARDGRDSHQGAAPNGRDGRDAHRGAMPNGRDAVADSRDLSKTRVAATPSAAVSASGSQPHGSAKAHPTERRHVRSADLRKLRDRVAQIELRIHTVEQRQTEISEQFAEPDVVQDVARLMTLQTELDELNVEHETLLADWESAAEELERLEALSK